MHKTPPAPLYPTMKVAVTVEYVQACADCCRLAVEIASTSVADSNVSVLVLRPGRRHAHIVHEAEAETLPDTRQRELPISDTNGSAPGDVEEHLFASLPPMLNGLGTPNGFDHEAKARA
jgi:hypothetical protein